MLGSRILNSFALSASQGALRCTVLLCIPEYTAEFKVADVLVTARLGSCKAFIVCDEFGHCRPFVHLRRLPRPQVLGGLGRLHLEVTRDRILREYNIDASLGPLQVRLLVE